MSLTTPDHFLYAVLPDDEPETIHCYACSFDVCMCDTYDERHERDFLEAWI